MRLSILTQMRIAAAARRVRTRLRPLPLACAAMAVLLVVKSQALVHAVGNAPAALVSAGLAMVPAARAAGHEPAGREAGKPSGHDAPAAAPAGPPVAATGAKAASLTAPTEAALAATAPPPSDPPISEAERALLLDLRARRAAMESREQALAAKESLLAAAEKRLGERVEQLAALQSRLEALEAARKEHDEANWRGLVKTYETMRPRDAAGILNDLDMPVLLQVLDRMKEAKAAPVLAAMLPDRARAATAQLAAMRTRSVAPPTLPTQGAAPG